MPLIEVSSFSVKNMSGMCNNRPFIQLPFSIPTFSVIQPGPSSFPNSCLCLPEIVIAKPTNERFSSHTVSNRAPQWVSRIMLDTHWAVEVLKPATGRGWATTGNPRFLEFSQISSASPPNKRSRLFNATRDEYKGAYCSHTPQILRRFATPRKGPSIPSLGSVFFSSHRNSPL